MTRNCKFFDFFKGIFFFFFFWCLSMLFKLVFFVLSRFMLISNALWVVSVEICCEARKLDFWIWPSSLYWCCFPLAFSFLLCLGRGKENRKERKVYWVRKAREDLPLILFGMNSLLYRGLNWGSLEDLKSLPQCFSSYFPTYQTIICFEILSLNLWVSLLVLSFVSNLFSCLLLSYIMILWGFFFFIKYIYIILC